MKMMLSLEPQMAKYTLDYSDKLLMVGSCFSGHIGKRLQAAKFPVAFNPTGIVFDPLSLARHLDDYVENRKYHAADLVELDGLWHSWFHHSDFSSPHQDETLLHIHRGIEQGYQQLQSASFLFITLGTAFSYRFKTTQTGVANCHKAPKDRFDKILLTTDSMIEILRKSLAGVFELNPRIQVVLTVSPVKHIRDGIAENNRSKARLLETAHALTELEERCTYFPAYELVNDVLRDYRFYAPDMAHPSEQAVDFIFDFFGSTYMKPDTRQCMQEVLQIVSARNHKVLHEGSAQHIQFLNAFAAKTETLAAKLPMLDWTTEMAYFKGR